MYFDKYHTWRTAGKGSKNERQLAGSVQLNKINHIYCTTTQEPCLIISISGLGASIETHPRTAAYHHPLHKPLHSSFRASLQETA
jgi:hypothetical protein